MKLNCDLQTTENILVKNSYISLNHVVSPKLVKSWAHNQEVIVGSTSLEPLWEGHLYPWRCSWWMCLLPFPRSTFGSRTQPLQADQQQSQFQANNKIPNPQKAK
eukprot:c7449_g1_i1 orf=3-311(-)